MNRLLVCLLVACGQRSEPPVNDSARVTATSVVGGQHEARFPDVGYLMIGDPLDGPNCGATVIGPRAAITAAHCVIGEAHVGIGLGEADSGPAYPARAYFVHPDYNPNGQRRYEHDVAVLALEDSLDHLIPATIWTPSVGDEALYVGYGRVTRGGYNEPDGYTDERKSAYQDINAVGPWNVWVKGDGGGLCWGDSGGPLLDESTGAIYGVLADFDGQFYCKEGNRMIFTKLSAERDFIDLAIACSETDDPIACMR